MIRVFTHKDQSMRGSFGVLSISLSARGSGGEHVEAEQLLRRWLPRSERKGPLVRVDKEGIELLPTPLLSRR
jgi:hypothetical protein